MNWITTNIRLPEQLYIHLKLEAAKRRKSLSAIIREKLEPRHVNDDKKTLVWPDEYIEKLRGKLKIKNPLKYLEEERKQWER